MNVKGLPLRRSVTEAAKVRFQIEFAPQYEPFESARFSMKRSGERTLQPGTHSNIHGSDPSTAPAMRSSGGAVLRNQPLCSRISFRLSSSVKTVSDRE
jgi:hypothetical protein